MNLQPSAQQPNSAKLFALPGGSVIWAGGLSIVLIPLIAKFAGESDLSWLNPFLLAAFSFTHFLMTAVWFYRHPSVIKQHRFVAYGSPVVMLGIAIALYFAPMDLVVLAFRLGLFILYWHFAKQAFGIALWMAGPRARQSTWLRQSLLSTVLLIAAYGIMFVHTLSGNNQLFRLYVPNLELAPWTAHLFLLLAGIASLVTLVGLVLKREDGSILSWLKPFVPVLALYVWFEPAFFIAGIVVAPIFHGLQALPLTTLHERSDIKKILRWGFVALVGGWVILSELPNQLGSLQLLRADRLAAIWIFTINMHHFWIETYSWRGSSKKLIEDDSSPLPALRES